MKQLIDKNLFIMNIYRLIFYSIGLKTNNSNEDASYRVSVRAGRFV